MLKIYNILVAHKLVCAGFEPAAEFRKRKEGMLESEYNLDEIEKRILNGDGASWIKRQSEGKKQKTTNRLTKLLYKEPDRI